MPSETLPALADAPPEPATAPALVVRFTATERWLHWIHTVGFVGMLVTGLLLYLPSLTNVVGSRPTLKAAHLVVVVAWLAALLLVVILGNRRALRASVREINRFDQDDRDWLAVRGGRRTPQGRFNAGQKLHTVVQAGFSALFLVSGTLLWLGTRNSSLRLDGTITVHDGAMFLAVGLLAGHLWLALVWPATRHAMRGIVRGTVRVDWARRHHVKWISGDPAPPTAVRPRRTAVVLSAVVLLASGVAAVQLARDALGPSAPPTTTPAVTAAATAPADPQRTSTVPAPPPAAGTPPLQLAREAEQLEQAGDAAGAILRYRAAVRGLPERADIRTALAVTLARSGNVSDALRQLRRAVRARPAFRDARLYLGAVLVEDGQRAAGRAQLRRYLKAPASEQGAAFARQLLARG